MPLTPRLARIIAEMIDAKLDAEARVDKRPDSGPARPNRRAGPFPTVPTESRTESR